MLSAITPPDAFAARIRWESVPEQVRDYLDGLPKVTGGTVIEREGAAVYRLEPLQGAGAWSAEKNARRCALIDKDIDGHLTTDERGELDALERELRRHVNAVAPRPIEALLEDVRALAEKLGVGSEASA